MLGSRGADHGEHVFSAWLSHGTTQFPTPTYLHYPPAFYSGHGTECRTGLFAFFLPLPLKHAVFGQAAAVAVVLTHAQRRHRVSLALCPNSEQLYQQAVHLLGGAMACLLPPLASDAVAHAVWQLGSLPCYHLLTTFCQLAFSYFLTLKLMYQREWRLRRDFARRQGLASTLRALQHRRLAWQHLLRGAAVCTAALWLACLVTALHAVRQ